MKSLFIIYFVAGFIVQSVSAQVIIKGPVCVLPGIEYQYAVSQGDSLRTLQVCINGGQITGATGNCINNPAILMFRVKWDSTATAGSLSLVSSAGNYTLNTTITTPLNPGTISDSLKRQQVDAKQIPVLFVCSPATGGGCSAQYSYQWQQSADRLNWQVIPGATGQNLDYRIPLNSAMYFRRKVVNTVSNTVAYSAEIAFFVNPEIPVQGIAQ